jgi:hypothetical protein
MLAGVSARKVGRSANGTSMNTDGVNSPSPPKHCLEAQNALPRSERPARAPHLVIAHLPGMLTGQLPSYRMSACTAVDASLHIRG